LAQRPSCYISLSQGFLRRVHRWPILLPQDPSQPKPAILTSSISRRGKSVPTPFPPVDVPATDMNGLQSQNPEHPAVATPVVSPEPPAKAFNNATWSQSTRRTSAAETVLEQLRSRDIQKSATISGSISRNSRMPYPRDEAQEVYVRKQQRHSLTSTPPPPSPSLSSQTSQTTLLGATPTPGNFRLRTQTASFTSEVMSYPAEFLSLLDGEHHTDELATRFEAGWPLLEQWLVSAGGGKGDGDFGRVSIIYR
jgi:hypothetical protein